MVMVLGISIGYAQLVDNLSISGELFVEGKEYEGVYITAIELVDSRNASEISSKFILPTNVSLMSDPRSNGGSLTYKVTVYNNTNVTHWYLQQEFDRNFESNGLIGTNGGITVVTKDHLSDTTNTFNSNDWIPPKTTRDFYVTYTFRQNAQDYPVTFINYLFGIRMDAVHDEFLAVLNNVIQPDSYEYLSSVFDAQYKATGSVTIDSVNNPDVFANLFSDLKVNIDGQEKEATVVIRRENVDGRQTGDSYSGGNPKGCEYTLYITVDSTNPATVYAIAYTLGSASAGGKWSQLGELYEGTASLNADGTPKYATWLATTKTYTVANIDGKTFQYKVAQPNGDQYDIKKTFEDITSVADQNFYNSIDNIFLFKKIYDILKKHPGSTDPAVMNLQQAFTDAAPYYVNHNNGQEFKVVRNYTRAELIPVIKGLQKALDYYYQAYGE